MCGCNRPVSNGPWQCRDYAWRLVYLACRQRVCDALPLLQLVCLRIQAPASCNTLLVSPHILRQITVNDTILKDNAKSEQRQEKEYTLYTDSQKIWSSPITHDKLHQQAEAIQDML